MRVALPARRVNSKNDLTPVDAVAVVASVLECPVRFCIEALLAVGALMEKSPAQLYVSEAVFIAGPRHVLLDPLHPNVLAGHLRGPIAKDASTREVNHLIAHRGDDTAAIMGATERDEPQPAVRATGLALGRGFRRAPQRRSNGLPVSALIRSAVSNRSAKIGNLVCEANCGAARACSTPRAM